MEVLIRPQSHHAPHISCPFCCLCSSEMMNKATLYALLSFHCIIHPSPLMSNAGWYTLHSAAAVPFYVISKVCMTCSRLLLSMPLMPGSSAKKLSPYKTPAQKLKPPCLPNHPRRPQKSPSNSADDAAITIRCIWHRVDDDNTPRSMVMIHDDMTETAQYLQHTQQHISIHM